MSRGGKENSVILIDERLFRFRADFDFGLLRVAYVVSSLEMQSGWAAKRQQK